MKHLKTLAMVLLVPALFAMYEFTKIDGFFNVGAFIIVGMTLLQVFLSGVLFLTIAKVDLAQVAVPTYPSKLKLMFSRIVSILTTIYLVWGGHWLLGIVDLINLLLSFLLLFLISELRKEIIAKQTLFRTGGIQ